MTMKLSFVFKSRRWLGIQRTVLPLIAAYTPRSLKFAIVLCVAYRACLVNHGGIKIPPWLNSLKSCEIYIPSVLNLCSRALIITNRSDYCVL